VRKTVSGIFIILSEFDSCVDNCLFMIMTHCCNLYNCFLFCFVSIMHFLAGRKNTVPCAQNTNTHNIASNLTSSNKITVSVNTRQHIFLQFGVCMEIGFIRISASKPCREKTPISHFVENHVFLSIFSESKVKKNQYWISPPIIQDVYRYRQLETISPTNAIN